MYKWANTHFDDFEKNVLQHEVQDKTNKYKSTPNGNKISDQIRILIKLLLSMTYIFIVLFNVG